MFNSPNSDARTLQCPYCKSYSKQQWYNVAKGVMSKKGLDYYEGFVPELLLSVCPQCNRYTLWLNDKMILPPMSIAPWPSERMPLNIKEDFLEARTVLAASPKAASALLRICLQNLMTHLGEKGRNIELDIANLARKGLPNNFISAMLAARVIGPTAVPPGKINSSDDVETAMTLFNLINMMSESTIQRQRKTNQLYPKTPGKRRKVKEKPIPKKNPIKKREIIPTPTILYR